MSKNFFDTPCMFEITVSNFVQLFLLAHQVLSIYEGTVLCEDVTAQFDQKAEINSIS